MNLFDLAFDVGRPRVLRQRSLQFGGIEVGVAAIRDDAAGNAREQGRILASFRIVLRFDR